MKNLLSLSLLYPKELVSRPHPINMCVADATLFSQEFEIELAQVNSYLYSEVYVTSTGLAILTGNKSNAKSSIVSSVSSRVNINNVLSNKVIAQCISEATVTRKTYLKSVYQQCFYHTSATLEQAVLITDSNSHGYFHWLADVLPKVIACQDFITKGYVLLLPKKFFSAFALDSLLALGIPQECIHIIPHNCKVMVNKLLVLDHLALPYGTGNYRPALMQQIRETIIGYVAKNSPTSTDRHQNANVSIDTHTSPAKPISPNTAQYDAFPKKIYISRKDAKYRYILNEEALYPTLAEAGFCVLKASELNFYQQVQLFSHAEVLLGLHGAGLSNILWMPAKSKIIEIRNAEDAHNNCYFSLASALQQNYYYSLAETSSTQTHKANFIWNKKQLKTILQAIHA